MDAHSSSIMAQVDEGIVRHGAGAFCDCFWETLQHPDGELLELHVHICELHMLEASKELDLRVSRAIEQLTLELPSRDGRPGVDDAD